MENVNKQLLERWASFGKAMQKAGSELPRHLIADTEQAIAAAEQAQQDEPVARDVLMQVAEMVRDECASAWCDRANKEFEVDITTIVDRFATTANQARAIINEQAEKLAKGRQQWEKVSQPPAVAASVPDGWDAESVRLAFSTLRYIIGLKPDGIKAPFDHVQDIIEKVASWSDMGPCHPVRKQYEAAAAHRAMLAAAQKGGAA